MLQGLYIRASGPPEIEAPAGDFSPVPTPLSFGNSKQGFLTFCFQQEVLR